MKLGGIQGRLLLIFALSALAVVLAGLAALRALDQIGGAAEAVTGRDLPAATAVLRLARTGESLQQRGASLIAADEPDALAREQAAVERDLESFAAQLAVLRTAQGDQGGSADQILQLADGLAARLRDLRGALDDRAGLAARLEAERLAMLGEQDRMRQIIGPSILAIAAITGGSTDTDAAVYRTAVRSQAPLLSAERLIDLAVADLLLAVATRTAPELAEIRAHYARILSQLGPTTNALPAGLRPGVADAVRTFDRQAGPEGIFALRQAELASLAQAGTALDDTRLLAADVKAAVDRQVIAANDSMAAVTEDLRQTIVSRTTQFITIGLGVVLLASGLSWVFVIRPLGRNLSGVTEAMTRLASGEREAQVPGAERSDEIGDLARAFNVFRDNAFRMEHLDRQLAERSGLLLATFETMKDGFSVFDRDRRLVAWNPHFLTLYGFEPQDLAEGMPIARVNRILTERGATAFMRNGEAVDLETLSQRRLLLTQRYELRFPAGRVLELRSNPIPRGGFATIHMDVTDQRATESQLLQAQKMESVGQLTGGIAHDFNNILAVIIGNLNIIARELTGNPALKTRAERALAAADRAAGQVNRLLAFSRRQRLAPEDVDINALVAGMLDLLGNSLGAGINLRTEFGEALPRARVDPGQLENALMNLAVNARDAMEGAGEITVTTGPAAAGFIEVSVSDTGTGIPPDLLDQVFEPFFTTKPAGKGSGLGLSMVYGFVRQSGGTVTLDSRAGEGTRVTLCLPVATAPAVAPPVRGDATGDECVLAVDDDADLLEITAGQLRAHGYFVVTAESGDEALALLTEVPEIRLLYTDLAMPGTLDGLALAQAAQALRPDLAVLFTSGAPGKAGEGLADLLRKPVPEARLVAAVREKLDAQSLLTSASST
ncbi:ATP-binding protein [Tropicimonas sp. IMCC34043]|uniref:ATP-binding protein n=1 Tax=Tropicimonas sp. IMCC34043 TaxID=2248760 RepID=UPI000E282776|nr:ATP-binding protein [Tropicimonas sp. IMCC34043]